LEASHLCENLLGKERVNVVDALMQAPGKVLPGLALGELILCWVGFGGGGEREGGGSGSGKGKSVRVE
jgi:hypothetical protein